MSNELYERLVTAGFIDCLGTYKQMDIKSQSRFAYSTDPNVVKTACFRAFHKTKRRVVSITSNQVIEAVKAFDVPGSPMPNFREFIYYVVIDKKPTMTPEGFVSIFDQFLDRAKQEDGIVYVQANVPSNYVTNHLSPIVISKPYTGF